MKLKWKAVSKGVKFALGKGFDYDVVRRGLKEGAVAHIRSQKNNFRCMSHFRFSKIALAYQWRQKHQNSL